MYLPLDDGYSIWPDTPDQQDVYRYIRGLADLPPSEAIQAFYRLLWDGNAYPNEAVHFAWQKMIKSADFNEHKLNIINRCFYTLINPWHLDGRRDQAIEYLILWLDKLPSQRAQNPVTRHLRDTLRLYRESDYYTILRKHLYLLGDRASTVAHDNQQIYFGDLFPDYFFIYEAGTQTPDIEETQIGLNKGILQKRNRKLRQYHYALNQFYVRYQRSSHGNRVNPTHLPDDELYSAIDLYRPKRKNSFRSHSEVFKAKAHQITMTKEFKHVVYDHVMLPVRQLGSQYERWYGREFKKILDTAPNHVPLTRVVTIQVFRKLLNAVIKHDDSQIGGDQLYYLVTGTGSHIVTSILINIVLACEMVRFELEKRLAGLHHRFAGATSDAVQWLVKVFDYMNIALALNAKYLGYFQLDINSMLCI